MQVGVDLLVNIFLFHVGQDGCEGGNSIKSGSIGRVDTFTRSRKAVVGALEVVQCQANLFQVVGATGLGCSFTNLLHRRQKQTNKNGNNGNHHQQLDQGESLLPALQGRQTSNHTRLL